ncbi:MAG: flagellar hook-associated protein FlgK [Lachnospiraceae bacterium]|nr:flagellar hook-associated protein FlgK [Lachnospiraceae bacterium]
MPSQFFGLNIAYTGLQAANVSLNTTANNISNVETEGYTRQNTVQKASDALHTWTTYGMAGSGVDTIEINQTRNQYYDLKYWQNNASAGTFDIKRYYMEQLENYFTETDMKQGFGTIYKNSFHALEEVYKSPGDGMVKTQYLAAAQSLCDYFASMYTSLQEVQLDANAEIKNKVDEINSIASQVATLNQQINTIEITGSHANELRDQRALLVDELSKIVDVKIKETPIYVSEDSTEPSGIYTYSVDIAGGQSLVLGYEYNTLECTTREKKLNQSDADGLYEVRWTNGIEFNLYGKNLGGELKGLMEVRDGNNEEYFHGKDISSNPPASGTWSDGHSYHKIVIEVEEDYLMDINKTTLPEEGLLTLVNKDFEYVGWTYDEVDDGTGNISHQYTFYIEELPGPQFLGGLAAVGREIDYQGIPYYMEQMNEWVRVFAEEMNFIEKQAQDEYGEDAQRCLFTGADLVDGSNTFTFDDFTRGETSWRSDDDSYYRLTAANFQVNQDMIHDVKKFGTSLDIHQGQDVQNIAKQLLSVQNQKGIRGCTSKEFLQTILSDVALAANSANTFSAVYSDISKAIVNQRLSVSGVDNDEEALNLVKFQEAYNLSAKMMQVFTEIYDRLILQTGV